MGFLLDHLPPRIHLVIAMPYGSRPGRVAGRLPYGWRCGKVAAADGRG